jgi:hypothetical protein
VRRQRDSVVIRCQPAVDDHGYGTTGGGDHRRAVTLADKNELAVREFKGRTRSQLPASCCQWSCHRLTGRCNCLPSNTGVRLRVGRSHDSPRRRTPDDLVRTRAASPNKSKKERLELRRELPVGELLGMAPRQQPRTLPHCTRNRRRTASSAESTRTGPPGSFRTTTRVRNATTKAACSAQAGSSNQTSSSCGGARAGATIGASSGSL